MKDNKLKFREKEIKRIKKINTLQLSGKVMYLIKEAVHWFKMNHYKQLKIKLQWLLN